jgi:broad specificity phosphatase PhoE
MSSLYLIRHGQASFGAADYDRLSELGLSQARQLGSHFAARGVELDAIYTGPCRRQIDTAAAMIATAKAAGVTYPTPVTIADFDEYPAFAIIARFGPDLARREPALSALLDITSAGFEAAFIALMDRWVAGDIVAPEVESFAAFSARVTAAISAVTEREGRGKRIAVVTSGGPIAMAMRAALDLRAEVALRMAGIVANSGVAEFRYRGSRLTMFAFNQVCHLADRTNVTYR